MKEHKSKSKSLYSKSLIMAQIERWRKERWDFYIKYGIPEKQLKWHHHDKLAHYAKDAYDITYNFPIGFEEVEGIHSRTDFDLSQHQIYSKKDMSYIDQEDGNKKYIAEVIAEEFKFVGGKKKIESEQDLSEAQ